MVDLAKWVKEARLSKNMTQEELGFELDMTKANISSIENGRNNPSFETMLKIFELTNYSLPIPESFFINQNEMKKTCVVTIFDKKIKQQAFEIIEQYGMTPEQVFNLLLREIATTQSIPLRFDYLRKQDE